MVDENKSYGQAFKPTKEPENYRWAEDFAQSKLSEVDAALTVVDNKTTQLLKCIGAVAVGLAAAMPFMMKDNPAVGLTLIPTWLALMLGAFRASQSLQPKGRAARPSIDKAFDYANHFDSHARAIFYASFVDVEANLRAPGATKGLRHRIALVYLGFGLFWLPVAATYRVLDSAVVWLSPPSLCGPALCLLAGILVLGVACYHHPPWASLEA